MHTFLSSHCLETMGIQIWRRHNLLIGEPTEPLDFEVFTLCDTAGGGVGLLCLESQPVPAGKEGPLFRLLDAMLLAVQLKRIPLFAENHILQKSSLILLMGELLAQAVLKSQEPLDTLRINNVHTHQESGAKLLVTYHPLDLLVEVANKAKAWEDLKKLRSS